MNYCHCCDISFKKKKIGCIGCDNYHCSNCLHPCGSVFCDKLICDTCKEGASIDLWDVNNGICGSCYDKANTKYTCHCCECTEQIMEFGGVCKLCDEDHCYDCLCPCDNGNCKNFLCDTCSNDNTDCGKH